MQMSLQEYIIALGEEIKNPNALTGMISQAFMEVMLEHQDMKTMRENAAAARRVVSFYNSTADELASITVQAEVLSELATGVIPVKDIAAQLSVGSLRDLKTSEFLNTLGGRLHLDSEQGTGLNHALQPVFEMMSKVPLIEQRESENSETSQEDLEIFTDLDFRDVARQTATYLHKVHLWSQSSKEWILEAIHDVKRFREFLGARYLENTESSSNHDEENDVLIPLHTNLLVTSLLEELFIRIPSPPETEKNKDSNEDDREPEVKLSAPEKRFTEVLEILRKTKTLQKISDPEKIIEALVDSMEASLQLANLVESFSDQSVRTALLGEMSALDDARFLTALDSRGAEAEFMRRIGSSKEMDFQSTIEGLTDIDFDFPPSQANPVSDRGQKISAIFDSLFELLSSEQQEVTPKQIRQLGLDKVEALNITARSTIAANIREDNHAFSASQTGMGHIVLKREPTFPVQIKDVIGGSWREVEASVQAMLEYQEISHVYSSLTPRRKVNSNMLIIGPYGCGKNEFVRGLMNDSRIVGVSVTTERLMSYWFGQSDKNVRELFEACSAKRESIGKPVLVGWDEFDTLFSIGAGGHRDIGVNMQKSLQTILDGDKHYEGIGFIGLTNEPHKIPVPIYRRFPIDNIKIIQPLTPNERVELFSSFLSNLPTGNFDIKADPSLFIQATDYATGDLIGRIFDEIYVRYVAMVREKDPASLKRIHDATTARLKEGEPVNQQFRAALWEEHSGGLQLDAETVQFSVDYVTSKVMFQHLLKQQRRFYEGVDSLLEEAFAGTL